MRHGFCFLISFFYFLLFIVCATAGEQIDHIQESNEEYPQSINSVDSSFEKILGSRIGIALTSGGLVKISGDYAIVQNTGQAYYRPISIDAEDLGGMTLIEVIEYLSVDEVF